MPALSGTTMSLKFMQRAAQKKAAAETDVDDKSVKVEEPIKQELPATARPAQGWVVG